MSLLNTAVLGIQGLVGLAMLGAGGAKLTGEQSQVEDFERFGYPQWFRLATGGIEVIAGIALVGAIVMSPALAVVGGLLVGGTMVGAIATHVRVGDSISDIAPPALLLLLAIVAVGYHAPEVL